MILKEPTTVLVASNFNATTLSRSPFATLPNPSHDHPDSVILFAAPVGGNLRGPTTVFPGCETLPSGAHRCAAFRFMEGWTEKEFDLSPSSSVECFPQCTAPRRMDSQPNQGSHPMNELITTSNQDIGGLPMITLMDEDEQEAEDIRAAIEASNQMLAQETERLRDNAAGPSRLAGSSGSSVPFAASLPGRHNIPRNDAAGPSPLAGSSSSSIPFATNLPGRADIPLQPPRPSVPRVYVPDTHHIIQFFDLLEHNLPNPLNREDKFEFTFDGTVEQGAVYMWQFLQDFAAKQYHIEGLPAEVDPSWRNAITVYPLSLSGLLSPSRQSWMSGNGVGDGTRGPILKAVMELIFSDADHYQINPKTGNAVPTRPVVPRPVNNGPSRRLQFVAAGIFCAMWMVIYRTGPPMLSGVFLQALADWSSISDEGLVRHLCDREFQQSYMEFAQHPLHQPVPPRSAMHYFVEEALDGRELRTIVGQANGSHERDPLYHQKLCVAVAGYHLLSASREETFRYDPDVMAFRMGLAFPLANGGNFMDSFASRSLKIIPGMWCREIASPEAFWEHLEIVSSNGLSPTSKKEKILEAAIRRYLSLPGHPDCAVLSNYISNVDYEAQQTDAGLRARLLVLSATGVQGTPVQPRWRVTIELIEDNNHLEDIPRAMQWAHCMHSGKLWYNNRLINACLEPVPDGNPNFSRRFDGWLHSELLDLGAAGRYSHV
ncbi:hypothetical protein FRC09_020393 [Ceratobasidium sp. 395]|nr:hypothetical protein FRC09_020393 [Ceratobasidium sp. 395]